MTKKILTLSATLLLCIASYAQKVRFIPQWSAQSQFTGFYVAKELGFYSQEGLDVEIRHISPNSSKTPMDHLRSGEADIAGEQLLNAMRYKADGARIVNILQLSQQSALSVVTNFPIEKVEDLNGKTVGQWLVGYPGFDKVLEEARNVKINWVKAFNPINIFLYGMLDATLVASYNELISIRLTKGAIPPENILRFSEHGFNCPEDGLYVTESYYRTHKDTIQKFVRATLRGWTYTMEHFEESLDIAMKYIADNDIVTNKTHQRMMLEEVLRLLLDPDSGIADFDPMSRERFERMNRNLINHGVVSSLIDYDNFFRQ